MDRLNLQRDLVKVLSNYDRHVVVIASVTSTSKDSARADVQSAPPFPLHKHEPREQPYPHDMLSGKRQRVVHVEHRITLAPSRIVQHGTDETLVRRKRDRKNGSVLPMLAYRKPRMQSSLQLLRKDRSCECERKRVQHPRVRSRIRVGLDQTRSFLCRVRARHRARIPSRK